MSVYMILTILSIIAFVAGLAKIFQKAGYKAWEAIIPFYNLYIWLKIINKPLWWFIFLLMPFINVFTILLMVVETLKVFHKDGLGQQALGVIFPFIYLPYLGFSKDEYYTHPRDIPVRKKSTAREWADAIIFAVVAATIIRTFMVEAYTIPTPSMERSLLVGDYLFVSKLSYGPRVPMTPIAFPFAHHTLPLTDHIKAYVKWIRLPYYRYPAIREIENNHVVVFNYPDGDTVALQRQEESYYSLVRQMGREAVWRQYDVVSRPVDKRENYIKRCVGIPGDTLQIIDGIIYINQNQLPDPPGVQHTYHVITDGTAISSRIIQRNNVTNWDLVAPGEYVMILTRAAAANIQAIPTVKEVNRLFHAAGRQEQPIFPHNANFPWNQDNFGPVYIPQKGVTIEINHENIALYERVIEVYEGKQLEVTADEILINGQVAQTYTFEMDYFWMVGDNRHNSADSRYWGFVPEDHIVGRAIFVWLSLDPARSFPGNIRFGETFRMIR
jgi:signal peptidase I